MGVKLPAGAIARERELSLIERIERIERALGLSPNGNEKATQVMSGDVKINIGNVDSSSIPETSEKETLIVKLLALKEANPKAVKAAPSQIPAMSVEKLSTLIAEAEATIAAESAPSQEGAETTSGPGAGDQE